MEKIEIVTPEGHKLVETIKNGVKHISFEPIKTQPKTAEECWEEVVENYLEDEVLYWSQENCLMKKQTLHSIRPDNNMNVHLSKERAEAFVYLQALVTARDYYNKGWVANWKDNEDKYCIIIHKGEVNLGYTVYNSQKVLNFKSSEIRDKFYEDFKEWIEKAKELI